VSKGSGRRPSELSEQEWSNRWDAIFGRDEPSKQEAKDEPWSPVSIGVDVTSAGAHVIGIYALDADTSQIFYAKHHPAPQRTWVGLADEERDGKRVLENGLLFNTAEVQVWELAVDWAEQKLRERNT